MPKALDSVFSQSFPDWELIVVDDGSTDDTAELLKNYKDPRIRYYYQENHGRSAARNKGIELANGEYICFLDSDDYYLALYLERLRQFIVGNNYPKALIFSNLILEKEGHQKTITYPKPDNKVIEYLLQNTIGTIQVCLPVQIARQFNFDSKLSIGEDLELFTRICNAYPLCYNPIVGVVARVHSGRSVNKLVFNPGRGQLQSYRVIFKNNRYQKQIKGKKKRELLSNAFAAIGVHYFLTRKKTKSVGYFLLSIIYKPLHKQTKFRVYSLLSQLPLLDRVFLRQNVENSVDF